MWNSSHPRAPTFLLKFPVISFWAISFAPSTENFSTLLLLLLFFVEHMKLYNHCKHSTAIFSLNGPQNWLIEEKSINFNRDARFGMEREFGKKNQIRLHFRQFFSDFLVSSALKKPNSYSSFTLQTTVYKDVVGTNPWNSCAAKWLWMLKRHNPKYISWFFLNYQQLHLISAYQTFNPWRKIDVNVFECFSGIGK